MTNKNFKNEHQVETYKSLIAISIEGFKYLALLNGTAALSFVGTAHSIKPNVDIREPLCWFMGAFVLTGLCFLGSYITQLCLHSENMKRMDEGSHMFPLYVTAGMYLSTLFVFGMAVLKAGVALY